MPEGKLIVTLPPAAAEPLWQPAQVFVAGVARLLDANVGRAEATGSDNCEPTSPHRKRAAPKTTKIEVRMYFIVVKFPPVRTLTTLLARGGGPPTVTKPLGRSYAAAGSRATVRRSSSRTVGERSLEGNLQCSWRMRIVFGTRRDISPPYCMRRRCCRSAIPVMPDLIRYISRSSLPSESCTEFNNAGRVTSNNTAGGLRSNLCPSPDKRARTPMSNE
jgi:hypothetical protein